MPVNNYIAVLRIPQYTKNLFIFLPLFFALQLQEPERLFKVSLAFFSFCLLASAVYIFNDLYDIEEDSKHPRKKYRPLPAGNITRGSAIRLMACLLALGLSIAYVLSLQMFYLCLLYIALNTAYSVKLKHVPILDIVIIAISFVIRIFVGGVAADVPIYTWIVIMTFMLALFMALGKRRDDVLIFMETNNVSRKCIDGYNLRFIDTSMVIIAAVILVAYLMYTVSPETTAKFKTDKLYITAIFVLIGIIRYLQITILKKNSGSPTEILLKDLFIKLSIAGWLISFDLLVYYK